MDPGYEEAGQGEPESGVGAEQRAREHIGEHEDCWEVLDAHSDNAFEEGDRVLWD